MLEARFWLPCLGGISVIVAVALLFDPTRVGMHDFDRARLARCYLGASNLSAQGQESERAAKKPSGGGASR